MIEQASLVVTMGCSIEEACPKPIIAQMQKKLIEWLFGRSGKQTVGRSEKD
jgi:hypothetical protein